VHAGPDRGGHNDGKAHKGQAGAVALVHRVQVVRVAAKVPHEVAQGACHSAPDRPDQAEQGNGEGDEQVP
jgi:hypothetical protein